MTDPTSGAFEPQADERQRYRQLAHDLRTPLSVICMGLEALKQVRQDKEQFDLLLDMISASGTEPLKAMISALAEQPPR